MFLVYYCISGFFDKFLYLLLINLIEIFDGVNYGDDKGVIIYGLGYGSSFVLVLFIVLKLGLNLILLIKLLLYVKNFYWYVKFCFIDGNGLWFG